MPIEAAAFTLDALQQLVLHTTLNVRSADSAKQVLNARSYIRLSVTQSLKRLAHAGISEGTYKAAWGAALAASGLSASIGESKKAVEVLVPALPSGEGATANVAAAFASKLKAKDGKLVFAVHIALPHGDEDRNALVAALLPLLIADVVDTEEFVALNWRDAVGQKAGCLHLYVTDADASRLLTNVVLPSAAILDILGTKHPREVARLLHGVDDEVPL